MNQQTTERRSRRGRNRGGSDTPVPNRSERYRQLRHPFEPQRVFSDDRVADIHATALRVLSELGIKILLEEARKLFARAGASVDETDLMVRIGPEIIEEALRTAPRSWRMRAANPVREQAFENGTLMFVAGSGCPNTNDLDRGRRPGDLASYVETVKLQQHFDVVHLFGPTCEPQDVPAHIRHYDLIHAQLTLGDKPMFIYSRGTKQVEQSMELIRLAHNLSDEDFGDGVWATTVINTNSPRQIDIPMAQGLIDFARAKQLSVVTPFCLAGAMAPVTVAGALVLQHAEALAAIALTQLANPGAPVAYGGFASNVDMKSGAPAFGTPEHVRLSIGSGQLARHIGLPWRSAAGAASNTADMQAAGETHMSLWAGMQANATLMLHAAGWLEGGLTFGYEKFINDVEACQILAELCLTEPELPDDLAWAALEDVQPGGHFFATQHTMDRYRDAFYPPMIADLQNFGAWTEAGEMTSTQRAHGVWKSIVSGFEPPAVCRGVEDRIMPTIERMKAEGGAPPVSG
ncbi:MAG: trimethylamine methyltransferase family protein [Pseudomonadota bacterium]